MSCPKTNPNYPSTATLIERPIGVLIRRLDPDFDKQRRFDLAYDFPRRKFYEDAMLHGAYFPIEGVDFNVDFSGDFGGSNAIDLIDAAFRKANGFCDPVDNGNVFTGTGAGGANPGTVPSLADENTDFGTDFNTANGIGVVFKGE